MPTYVLYSFRDTNLTVNHKPIANDVSLTRSPVKMKMTGRDLQIPVAFAFVLVFVVGLVSLANFFCCCFYYMRGEGKERKEEKPALLI